jgi:hypothetical protein
MRPFKEKRMEKIMNPLERKDLGRRGFLKLGIFGLSVPILGGLALGKQRLEGSGNASFIIIKWYNPEELVSQP